MPILEAIKGDVSAASALKGLLDHVYRVYKTKKKDLDLVVIAPKYLRFLKYHGPRETGMGENVARRRMQLTPGRLKSHLRSNAAVARNVE